MKYLIILIPILTTLSCDIQNHKPIDEIAKSTFEVKQISRGNNTPKIDITNDNMHVFLMALHYKIPVSEIANKLNWNSEATRNNIDLLIENKLLKKVDDKFIPSLGIFPTERGYLLTEKCALLAHEIADSIVSINDEINVLHDKTDISKTYSFHDLSFFYLSNILLDNGQINNVEREFLGKERPSRNGSNYYLAILEKEEESIVEPYGIYGNQVLLRNDSTVIAVYGNTRTELNKGWQTYENKRIHSFSKNDFNIVVNEMPKSFLPTLIKILNKHKADFEKTYRELKFDEETSFEEFFIWWYHIIYTETTDILIKQNLIKSPENGLFYYELTFK